MKVPRGSEIVSIARYAKAPDDDDELDEADMIIPEGAEDADLDEDLEEELDDENGDASDDKD